MIFQIILSIEQQHVYPMDLSKNKDALICKKTRTCIRLPTDIAP